MCVCSAQQVFWQTDSPLTSLAPDAPTAPIPLPLRHPIMWNDPVWPTAVTYLRVRLMFLY